MSLCTVLRAVPGGCKWLVAVAALSSIRVPLPFSVGTLRRHDDAFELYASHYFLFCLKKIGNCPGSVRLPSNNLLLRVDVLGTANTRQLPRGWPGRGVWILLLEALVSH